METSLKVLSFKIRCMDLESINIKMGLRILENGLMANNTVKGRRFGQKVLFLKGSLETARNMARGNMFGYKDADMMEIGTKIKLLDTVVMNGKTAELILDIG